MQFGSRNVLRRAQHRCEEDLFVDQQFWLQRTGTTATRATTKRANGAAGFAKLLS